MSKTPLLPTVGLLFGSLCLAGCLFSEAPNEVRALEDANKPPPPAIDVRGALTPGRHTAQGGRFKVRGTLTPALASPRRGTNGTTITPPARKISPEEPKP